VQGCEFEPKYHQQIKKNGIIVSLQNYEKVVPYFHLKGEKTHMWTLDQGQTQQGDWTMST
jgi:hypothetical protein